MGESDTDYVTVLETAIPHKFLVVVMKYRKGQDDYVQGRCSQVLPEEAARALATSWAAALGLEVR